MKMVPPVTPFVGLPLVEGCYVIYETQNVQYLIKTIKFVKLRKFKLDDHQFSLTGRIKDTDQRDTFLSKEDGKPLILDCLEGIDKSIYNVLVRLRDFYNERNAGKEERERTYVFVCHKQLDTAIIVSAVLSVRSETFYLVNAVLSVRSETFTSTKKTWAESLAFARRDFLNF